MPREQQPRFADDLTDPTPRSSDSGAAVGRMQLNTCDVKDEDFSRPAKWQSLEERKDKPVFNPLAEEAARNAAALPETVALLDAENSRRASQVFDAKGKLVGSADVVRTEEVLADEPTYKITRFNDGTVRTDLRKL